jgi:hypothetical protein
MSNDGSDLHRAVTTREPQPSGPLAVDPLDLAWLLVTAYRGGRADEAADAAARWRATVTPALTAAERHSRAVAARRAAYAQPALTAEEIRARSAASWAAIEHQHARQPGEQSGSQSRA